MKIMRPQKFVKKVIVLAPPHNKSKLRLKVTKLFEFIEIHSSQNSINYVNTYCYSIFHVLIITSLALVR